MSSDEQYLEDPDARDDGDVLTEDNSTKSVSDMRVDDPTYAPQNPGDPGYEPKAVIPELDGEGGTVFKVGDEEYSSMKEALESQSADAEEGSSLERSQDPARLDPARDDEFVEER
jgi:hypothetical protein